MRKRPPSWPLPAWKKLVATVETIYDVLTAVEKIGGVTDLPLENPSENHIAVDPDKGLAVRMRNLSMGRDESGQPQLKGINLDIKPCERVAIAGQSGGGKVPLLQVLGGLHEDFAGSLAFNGLPIGNLNLESLRFAIGDSFQVEDVFAGTVFENISLGRPGTTLNQVQQIMAKLQLADWVEQLEKGYETVLLPGARNLPHSVVQRLKLARCLVINPRLILLENPLGGLVGNLRTAALEAITDASLNGTLVVVSNQRDLLERVDRIIWLENGAIRQEGTLAELEKSAEFSSIIY